MDILDKLIIENDNGIKYYDIKNNKGKRWLIKSNDLKNGFDLYQPTALKGILLKQIFPYMHKIHSLKRILNIKEVKCSLNSDLEKFLDRNFRHSYDISFFGGTPSVHQKAVLQISCKNKILAYCKISNSKAVEELFDKECDTLNYLSSKNVNNVPNVIARENMDNLYIFCQSNVKSKKSKTIKELNNIHIRSLRELYEKTKVEISFDKSDYYLMLHQLKNNKHLNDIEDKKLICKVVEKIEEYLRENTVNFAFYHGDFTPWNISVEQNDLTLFDFEYAKRTYPYYLDLFHFFLQTQIFVKKNNNIRILSNFEKLKKKFRSLNIDFEVYFIMYLLEIINLYISRTDNETEEEKQNYKIRIELLRKLVEEKWQY